MQIHDRIRTEDLNLTWPTRLNTEEEEDPTAEPTKNSRGDRKQEWQWKQNKREMYKASNKTQATLQCYLQQRVTRSHKKSPQLILTTGNIITMRIDTTQKSSLTWHFNQAGVERNKSSGQLK